jgi:hypothetical protein
MLRRLRQVEEADAAVQAAWQHEGRVTDMQVAGLGGFGEVLVMLSSSNGGLSFLKLFTPREQGAPVTEVEVRIYPHHRPPSPCLAS